LRHVDLLFGSACGSEGITMPSLKVTPREIGSVTILDLSGPIALGESSALFGKAIRELTSNDRTKIILNLRDVSSVDSAGIGELVRAYILVKTRTGEMKLLNPTKKVYDLLDITRLLRVLDVFTDEASALRSFG
jgi:anti-sigma B factor antagonist